MFLLQSVNSSVRRAYPFFEHRAFLFELERALDEVVVAVHLFLQLAQTVLRQAAGHVNSGE